MAALADSLKLLKVRMIFTWPLIIKNKWQRDYARKTQVIMTLWKSTVFSMDRKALAVSKAGPFSYRKQFPVT
jgi:hypothetical protein